MSVKTSGLLIAVLFSLFIFSGPAFCEEDSLIVTPDGNVGIGITNPQSTLHVNGDFQADAIVLGGSGKINGDTAPNGALGTNTNGDLVVGKNNAWTQVSSPVGSIIIWPTATPPAGYRECNGDWLSKSEYPELFTAIGTAYGSDGDNFRLPDFRGEFLRGWDHGKGTDTNREIGTLQSHEIQSHKHRETYVVRKVGTHYQVDLSNGYTSLGGARKVYRHSDGSYSDRVQANTYPTGGTETRPRNMAVMFCIKAK